MKKQVHLFISGMVQGVFFRASAARAAKSLGVTGWAKNLPNGAVELLAQGEEAQLNQMIDWCRSGPPGAHVTNLDIQWKEAAEELNDFKIK